MLREGKSLSKQFARRWSKRIGSANGAVGGKDRRLIECRDGNGGSQIIHENGAFLSTIVYHDLTMDRHPCFSG